MGLLRRSGAEVYPGGVESKYQRGWRSAKPEAYMRVLSPDMSGREKISDANRSRTHTTTMDLYSQVTDAMQADVRPRGLIRHSRLLKRACKAKVRTLR